MLVVADNLDRAIKVAEGLKPDSDSAGSLIEGLTATQRLLTKSLERFGIRIIECSNARFDPKQHEAVMAIKDTKHADGTILEVIANGYTIQDRLLIPARVVVAGSGPSAQSTGDSGDVRSI